MDLVERNKIQLVNSAVIEFENSKNPFEYKRLWINSILQKAKLFQNLTNEIILRAKEIKNFTIDPLDALHVATAEKAEVDFFLTCDYNLIRKYKGKIKILNPVDFIKIIKL